LLEQQEVYTGWRLISRATNQEPHSNESNEVDGMNSEVFEFMFAQHGGQRNKVSTQIILQK
jgi:hypothetical protein